MGVNEGSLQVIDIAVILENLPTGIVLLYGTYLPVALVVFVIYTISYICDSMSKIVFLALTNRALYPQ